MRLFYVVSLFAISLLEPAFAQGSTPFLKKDSYSSDNTDALVLITYRTSTCEVRPATLQTTRINTSTGQAENNALIDFGQKELPPLRQPSRMRRAGFDFLERRTFVYVATLPPGTYVITGAQKNLGDDGTGNAVLDGLLGSNQSAAANACRRTGGPGVDQYTDMSESTFAFTVEAGKINDLGDYEWGSRRKEICKLTREEYLAANRIPPTYEQERCFAAFAETEATNSRLPEDKQKELPNILSEYKNIYGVSEIDFGTKPLQTTSAAR